ncbi:MAG TPA: sugar porter family MFS transporter, partial [Micromonospora sp.]|nr:sugar porter family MFS transporter [Micromonospora sp.]
GFLGEQQALSGLTQGVIVSAVLVGGAVGALGGGPLADRLGRKPVIFASGVIFALGALASAVSGPLSVLITSRVVLGLGVGAISVLVPVYIAELAAPRLRGLLVSMFQLLITVGILLAYAANAMAADSLAWRWSLGLAAVPGVLLALGAIAVPESPRWLVTAGRSDEAAAVLRRLRGHAAAEELAEIHQVAPDAGTKVRWRELLRPSIRPMLIVGMLMAFFAQMAGINAVIYFAPAILENAGLGTSATWWATIGLGIVNVALTMVGMLLVDRMGRKPLLLIGAVGMTLSLGLLALTFGTTVGIVTFLCLAIYIVSYAVGPGLLAFVIISEIYPLRYRGAATGIALLVNFLANIVVAVTFLPMLEGFGDVPTFWIYTAICALFVLFALTMVPETKGRSLEQIEAEVVGERQPAAA